jgi:hypothetical protein
MALRLPTVTEVVDRIDEADPVLAWQVSEREGRSQGCRSLGGSGLLGSNKAVSLCCYDNWCMISCCGHLIKDTYTQVLGPRLLCTVCGRHARVLSQEVILTT